jgi:HEAT repeat protein
MAQQEIDNLFAQTLQGSYDDDAAWNAVRELRRLGSREVFERAALWCKEKDPLRRARGADILAQLGKTAHHPKKSFPDESFAAISTMLENEQDVRPLSSAIYALGPIGNEWAIPMITAHQSHPDADVRFAVGYALGSFASHPNAVVSLLVLVQDMDEEVRDWATFNLGVIGDADSPKIRDVLCHALGDSNNDVREEAMVRLGKRKDARVLEALIAELEQPEMTDRIREAACEMLNMQADQPDWSALDYVEALRHRFDPKN